MCYNTDSQFLIVQGGDKVTESEFHELMITVGYRYEKKSQSAFNSFEGFRTIIEFNKKDNKYSLRVKAGTDDISLLKQKLKSYADSHKNHVIKAKYADKYIRINIRMTIDSEIDKNELKQLVHFMTELFKSGTLVPLCSVCSRNRKTGLYIIGTELCAVCDKCLARKQRQYEIRRNRFVMKKQNMPLGLIGAVFGAFLGASVYILLYQFMPTFGMGGVIIIIPSFIGFVITGKRATVQSAVVCAVISWLIYILAEYTAIVANMAVLIERAGGGIAVSEAMEVINASFSDTSYLMPIIDEIIMGTIFMAITGGIYFLKRSLTRPFKISNNIL